MSIFKIEFEYVQGSKILKEPEPDDDMCKCPCHRGVPIFCSCWIGCCEMPFAVWRREDDSIDWVKYNLLMTRAVRSKAWMKKRGYNKEERG